MRSWIKEYDMFKAGEYIKESSDDEMLWWKIFDKIPDENLKLQILRLSDKIRRKNDLLLILALGMCIVLGIIIGYFIGLGTNVLDFVKEHLVFKP